LTTRALRAPPELFLSRPLRAHALLADVPLHDVWLIRLRGGGEGRRITDLLRLASFETIQDVSPIVAALFRLRGFMGRVFRWEGGTRELPSSSYVHRLSREDRARTLEEPGGEEGPFRIVYTFEREALREVINPTVHAFSLMAMAPARGGYDVYWAIYVKRVSWLTPLYMALIDPFRRLFIYPSIIRHWQGAWETAYRAV
jgi:hypothetical protein